MAVEGKTAAEVEARGKILEGVDFIETEEDAEAVESAVVKIQSTFRGKKIRSKLGAKKTDSSSAADKNKAAETAKEPLTGTKEENPVEKEKEKKEEEELNKKVATMQVNDNTNANKSVGVGDGDSEASNIANKLPAEERAATKIQAGFKGYKARKELAGQQQLAEPSLGSSQPESGPETATETQNQGVKEGN